MEREVLLKECVAYFKSYTGFDNIFKKMKEKYQSLGKVGGTVVLTHLSKAEKEALTGLLRKDYSRQKSATISLEKFETALTHTRFEGLTLEEILKAYFKEEMISNKVQRMQFLENREAYFSEIISVYQGTLAGSWLEDSVVNQCNVYPLLIKKYNEYKAQLKKDMQHAANALNNLPYLAGETKGLALFASQITKNPHAFDAGTDCGMLLQYAIMYQLDAGKPQNAEERAELYYRAGILIDEISNYTICSGLRAMLNGREHSGWQGFYETCEPMQISLKNLSKLERIISPIDKVFVVENPTVFSTILDKMFPKPVPLVCTYGQVKLASLILLDKLVEAGVHIYYSGDFDPEGLLIADRLKSRYKAHLSLWGYSQADYYAVLSQEQISANRLKKLDNLKDKQLKEIAQSLIKEGYAGYQELLIDKLITFI